jgi:hypothetical protein
MSVKLSLKLILGLVLTIVAIVWVIREFLFNSVYL